MDQTQTKKVLPQIRHKATTGLVVGEIIVADIIGNGFYEIDSFGDTFVNVKLLKLFCQGWKHKGHVTNCHNYPNPINLERWASYRRVMRIKASEQ